MIALIWFGAVLALGNDPIADSLFPSLAGERPAIRRHLDQGQIERGAIPMWQVLRHGKELFEASFNRLDGQGRPASTGTGEPRLAMAPAFLRTSGPDANSCMGCHNQPRTGGGGEFVANVFVLAQAKDPVTFSVASSVANERNSLGMFGSGAIELLAREMSAELIAIREEATREAQRTGQPATRALVAKRVHFGHVTVLPDGRVDPREIEGVDWDLIVKPFHQKGAVVSLREFSVTAMNHHHGMQATERFGANRDADRDGISNELTEGDITAISLFQASLGVPGRLLPRDIEQRKSALRGQELFASIGCAQCHIPALWLSQTQFTEPNPYNPTGTLRPENVQRSVSMDLQKEGGKPRLEPAREGGSWVRAFTDLKRHQLNDEELDHFQNERIAQGTKSGFAPASAFTVPVEPRSTSEFLTRKLWDAGNSMPYGHRGDLTTLSEAIHFHGGEARKSRDAFFALAPASRTAIVDFLKTLQVLPEGSSPILLEAAEEPDPELALSREQ